MYSKKINIVCFGLMILGVGQYAKADNGVIVTWYLNSIPHTCSANSVSVSTANNMANFIVDTFQSNSCNPTIQNGGTPSTNTQPIGTVTYRENGRI